MTAASAIVSILSAAFMVAVFVWKGGQFTAVVATKLDTISSTLAEQRADIAAIRARADARDDYCVATHGIGAITHPKG